MPPSGIEARRAMDSRRRESRKALLPLRAIDFRRACPVLVPSSALGGSRDFVMMYLGRCKHWAIQSQSRCHIRILVRILAQIKAGIVYHVALLHDVGAHGHVTSRSILADGLQADVVVWVGGSGKTLKHALLGQEQGTDVDGENGAFFDGILLVELDVLGEQMEGLGLVLEHLEDAVAARDNDDIKIVELGIGIVVVHVGLDGEALDRRHGGGGADELAVEGLAGCRRRQRGMPGSVTAYTCPWGPGATG